MNEWTKDDDSYDDKVPVEFVGCTSSGALVLLVHHTMHVVNERLREVGEYAVHLLTQVELECFVDILLEIPRQISVLVTQRPYVHLQNTNDARLSAYKCSVCYFVCLSICHTLADCVETAKRIIKLYLFIYRHLVASTFKLRDKIPT